MKKKHMHFVGIKGVGMTPLAIIAKEAGMKVTGSDVAEEFITDVALRNSGITPLIGFAPEHITGAELVITTGAHGGLENVEVVAAKKANIPVMTQGEAVGAFMDGGILDRKFFGISVAGTHGKTTTTAMIATMLTVNKKDPSYIIGTGSVPSLKNAGHFGKGEYFVAEADEYVTEPKHDRTTKFLWQKPKIAVFTNIELDHPDVYKTVDDMRNVYGQFAKELPTDGTLIACGDSHQVQRLLQDYTGAVITYGFSPSNDFVITHTNFSETTTFFRVSRNNTPLGEFMLSVAGEHNVLNALASIIVGLETGLSVEQIKDGLKEFRSSKRRMEYKGKFPSGAVLYDDYAHHPTEIKETLRAFKAMYPKKQLICIFQPHTYSRTKALFSAFVTSFSYANTVIVTDIYPSAREDPDPSVSSELLVREMRTLHKDVTFLPDASDVIEYLDGKFYHEDTVVITMGAGDIYKIAERFTLEK